MKRKINLDDLKVTSFVTGKNDVKGGKFPISDDTICKWACEGEGSI